MNKEIKNHPSALDIDEIWAAIEPQVDELNAQRKKRKPVFIYCLSGLVLLVGLGLTGLFLFGENLQPPEILNEVLPESTTQNVVPIITTENNLLVKKEEVPSFSADLKTAPVATTTSVPKAEVEEITVLKSTLVAKDIIKKTAPSSANSTQLKSAINKVVIPNNPGINNSTIPVKEEKIASVSPLTISKIGLTVPASDLPELNFSIKNNKPLVPPPLYIERPTFSIEFQTGISAVNRTLNPTGNSPNNLETASLRSTFEEPLEALHANILVNAHFPSGFFVSSGVGFTQISELYNNNSTVIDSIIDPMGIQKLIINITGDTVPVIGPVVSTRTTTFIKKYYNSYRMIDIPLFVGYQYDFGDWKTDFSLGVFTNILLATEGRIPDTPTTDLDLNTNGDEIYRSRVDYSLQFGIGVSKSLTDRLSLRVNPMFRYYSRNFIKESVGLEQQYLLFGGTVGLRMDL